MIALIPLLTVLLGSTFITASPLSARENESQGDHRKEKSGGSNDGLVDGRSLSQLARQSNKYFGTAYQSFYLADERFEPILNAQFDQYTHENELKWESVQPERGVFNWTGADLVSFLGFPSKRYGAHAILRSLIKRTRPELSSVDILLYGTRNYPPGFKISQTRMTCWM